MKFHEDIFSNSQITKLFIKLHFPNADEYHIRNGHTNSISLIRTPQQNIFKFKIPILID